MARLTCSLLVVLAACGPADREGGAGADARGGGGDGPGVIDAHAVDAPPSGAMVPVPAGAFTMGADDGDPDEAPAHTVTLGAFEIDRTEVTQEAYAACVTAGACTTPSRAYTPDTTPAHPVVAVTFAEATSYCTYAGKRLPTEAEWEKAARGTDARMYPWGDDAADPCTHANVDVCGGEVADVGTLPAGASPYGALDLAGNVWEYTADWYAEDAYAAHDGTPDPSGPATGTIRVYRGGSSGNGLTLARAANRASTYSPMVGGTGLGFRCAR